MRGGWHRLLRGIGWLGSQLRKLAFEFYRWLLLVEAVALIARCLYGGDGSLTRMLSALIALLSVAAFIDMTRERRKVHRRRRPWTMPVVIAAEVSLIPYFLAPLWIETRSASLDLLDGVLCSVAAFGLGLALIIVAGAIAARPSRAMSKTWAVVLALLPLASSVQYWYSAVYRPAHERPDVNITASLERVGTTGFTSRIKATVTLENDGPTSVVFFAATYTITAFDLSPAAKPLSADDVPSGDNLKVAFEDTSKSYRGLLRIGRLIRPDGHLAPGQKLTTSVVFEIANDAQDKLRLTVLLSTIADNGLSWPNEPEQCTSPIKLPSHCEQVAIPVQGWLAQELSDHPRAQTIYTFPTDRPPGLATDFYFADSPSTAQDIYGLLNSRRFTTSVEYSVSP